MNDKMDNLPDQKLIIRANIEDDKTVIGTDAGKTETGYSLDELERILDGGYFARVNSDEIVNLLRVMYFDLAISGIVRAVLDDRSEAVVSRKYIDPIRQILRNKCPGGEKNE